MRTPAPAFRRWGLAAAGTGGLLAVLLALPLALFALLSWLKLGFVSLSYYVPHEAFWQDLASGDPQRVYGAPLVAVNVTSGLIIANMLTYTLGHTLVTVTLAALVASHVARALRRARACVARPGSAASVGGASAGAFAATVASSSAALTGCCGAGMAGGIVALAGLGSVAGAWMSEVATWAQAALAVTLAVLLLADGAAAGRVSPSAPLGRLPHGESRGE